jgi:hypothetical protein
MLSEETHPVPLGPLKEMESELESPDMCAGTVYCRRNVECGWPALGLTRNAVPPSTTAALAPLTASERTMAASAAVFTSTSVEGCVRSLVTHAKFDGLPGD